MSGHIFTGALRPGFVALGLLALSGCAAPVAVLGLGVAGSVAQERSTRDQMSDLEIGLSIQNAFARESKTLFQAIDLEVVEGRVLLAGSTPNPQTRARAVEIAQGTPQVVEVIDEIRIAPSAGAGDYANDTWISTQVRTKLVTARGVNPLNFNVDTSGGVVHLMGVASDADEIASAARAAASVPGVKEVVSHVLLVDDPRRKPPAPPIPPART